MGKKTLATATRERESLDIPADEVIRVEESVEDFISLHLPSAGGCVLEVVPLWSDGKTGSNFFRCNYWKYDYTGFNVVRSMVRGHFVRIDRQGNEKILVDLIDGRMKDLGALS